MTVTSQSSATLLDRLHDLVAQARKQGADAADAMMVRSASLSVGWRMGQQERLERSEATDLGLRVLVGQQQALVSTSDLSAASLSTLVERAVSMARVVPADPWVGLADPTQLAHQTVEIDGFDPYEPTVEQLLSLAQETEDYARSVKGITNSEGADAGWGTSEVALVASNGFSRQWRNSGSSLSVSVLAGQGDGMERDYDYTSAVYFNDLQSPKTIAAEAAQRAVARLNPRSVKTGKLPVILEPRIARGLLASFAGAINGAAVARGSSFLKDSLEKMVFGSQIRILDDPHRQRGLRSRPCDAEGVATTPRWMVEDGRLTSWFLDCRAARQLGMSSTGHASRGASSLPSPSATNLSLAAGHITPEEMICDLRTGLYITELFGQGVNMVTGDYSRGASGFWIENGKIAWPVSGFTLAGNLKDMFLNLTPASDLELRHGVDSPTLRIDGMTVAGV